MVQNINKTKKEYKSIGEVAKELNLIDKKTGQLQTHTIRYWETKFKQKKQIILAGRRRYYSNKSIKVLIYIKSLLKEKGLTINGVKKILDGKDLESIDDYSNLGLYNNFNNSTKIIKNKLRNISKIVKELKKIKDG